MSLPHYVRHVLMGIQAPDPGPGVLFPLSIHAGPSDFSCSRTQRPSVDVAGMTYPDPQTSLRRKPGGAPRCSLRSLTSPLDAGGPWGGLWMVRALRALQPPCLPRKGRNVLSFVRHLTGWPEEQSALGISPLNAGSALKERLHQHVHPCFMPCKRL